MSHFLAVGVWGYFEREKGIFGCAQWKFHTQSGLALKNVARERLAPRSHVLDINVYIAPFVCPIRMLLNNIHP